MLYCMHKGEKEVVMRLEKRELRVLLLFASVSAGTVVTADSLFAAVSEIENGNLDIIECFEELSDEGLLRVIQDGDKRYVSVTPNGRLVVEELQGMLPVTLRKNTASRMAYEIVRLRRDLCVTAEYCENVAGTGYYVTLTLSEDGEKLFSSEIFAPTAIQAEMMVKRFRENPAAVYGRIITDLSNNTEV